MSSGLRCPQNMTECPLIGLIVHLPPRVLPPILYNSRGMWPVSLCVRRLLFYGMDYAKSYTDERSSHHCEQHVVAWDRTSLHPGAVQSVEYSLT